METDKVIVIEKTGYRSEDIISCNGVARCIRNHGYRGGVVIVEDYDQNRREMKKTDRVMTVESGRHRAYRIYKTEGISPAITTPSGGGLIPKIIEMKENPKIVSYSRAEPFVVACRGREPNVLTPKRTEEAKLLRKDYENHRINIQRKYMQQLEPRIDGVSNTITSVQKDNMLLEPLRIKANTREGFAEEVRRQPCGVSVDKDNNLRPYRQDKAKSGVAELQTEFAESVGSTLTSARPNNVYGDTFPYRIRRLIPRECFRLMDVDDEDYNKIKNYVKGHRKNGKPMYISESQQYKLAGNSIVVACMEHIFEQLFFPSGRVTEPRQLDIFDIIQQN